MREIGWAKINLALHVRARRPDGYHEIETLFAFVDGGDTIAAEIAEADTLTIDGEFAAGLSVGADNLVLRVPALLRERHGPDRVPPLSVRPTKIGRASCRESVCQDVVITVVAGALTKKNYHKTNIH